LNATSAFDAAVKPRSSLQQAVPTMTHGLNIISIVSPPGSSSGELALNATSALNAAVTPRSSLQQAVSTMTSGLNTRSIMSPSPSSSSGDTALNATSGVCAAMTALHGSAGGPVFINFSDKLNLVLQTLSDIEQLIEQHIIKPSSLDELGLDDLGLPVDSEENLRSLEEKLRNKDFKVRMVCIAVDSPTKNLTEYCTGF